MQVLFIPQLVKENGQKVCLFTSIENFLDHMNNTTGIRNECGIQDTENEFIESDIRVEQVQQFSLLFKTFSYAVFLRNKLIGYSCIDFTYKMLKNTKYSNPSSEVAQALKVVITHANEQYGSERLFSRDGQLYSVYEWLDLIADADENSITEFCYKFRAINLKVKMIEDESSNVPCYFWSINHVDSHTSYLELLMALGTLIPTNSQRTLAQT